MEDKEVLQEKVRSLIEQRNFRDLRDALLQFSAPDVAEFLSGIEAEDRAVVFRILPLELATETFGYFSHDDQTDLVGALGQTQVAAILNEMPADDRTAFLEECPPAVATQLLSLLSQKERGIAALLLGYPEDSVGRLMTPDFVAVHETWTVEKALTHVRDHGKEADVLNILYVLDDSGKLLGDIRIREFLLNQLDISVHVLKRGPRVALNALDDEETAVEAFRKYDRTALPVTDSQGHMIGIVTVDDVLDVAAKEATEDIQKIGAVEALDDPYIDTPVLQLVRKRAPWLVVLFFGEMLTATAMAFFEDEIGKAVVLALFIPLIISSGGNSGSQATSLIIRALALGELKSRDWFRVFRRELLSGLMLGSILALIGFLRIALWSTFSNVYGPHWMLVGMVIASSLMFVVLWGTLTGALFPLALHRLGFDPATSSAPLVATVVDVTGVLIYFSIAALILGGTLL